MHGIWEVSAVRVVVVGAGTAGASAAFAARMSSRDAEVIVLGDEPQPTYSRCALPFAVAGKVSPLEKVIVFGEKQFAARRIELIKPARARALETKEHALLYEFDGDEKRLEYDTLVLATGGRATPPPVDGVDLEGNLLLRTYADAERLIEAASSGTRFVVNGASFIALEAAEALKSRGADVSLVVRSRVMRSFVDEPLSRLLADHLRAAGLRVLQGASIERVEGASRVEAVVVGDEELRGVVKSTGDWGNFVTEPLGTIELKRAGKHTLAVKIIEKRGGAVMNLQAVRLVPGRWEPGLVAWWRFDEGKGTETEDWLGGAKDALHYTRWTRGASRSGLRLNGVSSHVVREAALAPALRNGLTIEAWVKLDEASEGWRPVVNCHDYPLGYFFGFDAAGDLGLHLGVGGRWVDCTSRVRPRVGEWTHVAATYDLSLIHI